MRYQNLSEKKRSSVLSRSKTLSSTSGCVAIIICQHVLLWSALYVAGSATYALAIGAILTNDIPSTVMFLIGSGLSLFYLALQNVSSYLRRNARDRWQSERVDTLQSLALFVLQRFLVVTWAVTSVLAIVLTASRGAFWPCHVAMDGSTSSILPLDIGDTCIVNRAEILASVVAAFASAALFILSRLVDEPSRFNLFGYIKEEDLLPLFLPYRKFHDQRMFCDMSFKCRSSSSLSSQTAMAPWKTSTTHLMSSESAAPLGLGIYTAHRSAPSLLHPRPSLSSIRSRATMRLPPPPTEPLPPLPACFPPRHPQARQKAVYKPRRLYGLHPKSSLNLNGAVGSCPNLSRDSLATLKRSNRSQRSLTSVYSRSISGERPGPPSCILSDASDSSLSTTRRRPLGSMRLASQSKDTVSATRSSSSSCSSRGSEIDDVAALHARIDDMLESHGMSDQPYISSEIDSLREVGHRQH